MNELEGVNEDRAVECLAAGKKLDIPNGLVMAIGGVAVTASLFAFFTGWFGVMQPQAQMTLCLSLFMILAFLLYPIGRKGWKEKLLVENGND